MINTHILMSDAQYFDNQLPINPYYHSETVDRVGAQAEHDQIRHLLEEAGIKVTVVPSPSTSQDGIYTANWALVRGKKAILASLPNARKSEEDYAKSQLEKLGIEVAILPDGLKFSGQGDALPCGDLLFCGSGYRSDEAAQAIVAKTLGFKRIQLRAAPQVDENGSPITNTSTGWPDSFYYDLDLALAIIAGPEDGKKGIIAYCPEAFTPESAELLDNLTDVDKIIVSEREAREAFACNLVSTGQTVVMSAKAPEFSEKLRQHGLKVLSPEVKEIAKGGGYIRCTTLTID